MIAILAVIVVEASTVGPSDGLGALALLVACYSVATYRPWLPATVGLIAVVPAFMITNWVSDKGLTDDIDFVFAVCLAAWLAGRGVRSRQLLVDRLAAQSLELRAACEVEAAAMAAAERTRIARDLHDVLAHSISVIVVQAEAAEALLPDLERNRQALQAVQRTIDPLSSSSGNCSTSSTTTNPTGIRTRPGSAFRHRGCATLTDSYGPCARPVST